GEHGLDGHQLLRAAGAGHAAPVRGLVEYYVDEEETSLKDKYPREHLVFSDPKALHKQGWQALAETIMKQDVKVNLTGSAPSCSRSSTSCRSSGGG
uniref:Uncharacterized protein n=1 Tax=Aegilops tauschii subsp. strangulata TaxID=200361 RepID=A0A453DIY0_AEGTS